MVTTESTDPADSSFAPSHHFLIEEVAPFDIGAWTHAAAQRAEQVGSDG